MPSNYQLAMEWVARFAYPSIDGQRGDDALYAAACAVVNGFDLGDGEALSVMLSYNSTKCSPPWSEDRLRHKINQARGAKHDHAPGGLARWVAKELGYAVAVSPGYERRATSAGHETVAGMPVLDLKKKYPFDLATLKRAVAAVPAITPDDLRAMSPRPVKGVTAAEYLESVYQTGERVLIFDNMHSQGQFLHWVGKGSFRLANREGVTAVRSNLPRGGREGMWYLNQPITGEWKPKMNSVDKSRRSENVVTAWRYLVLESDEAPPDLWLRLLVQLPERITAIYTSGGRSIHALVRVDRDSKKEWDMLRDLLRPMLSRYGADPAAMTAVRLTRLPACWRGDREQRLLYLNPNPPADGIPINQGGNQICE
jgi:hypothetical protein